MDFRSINRTALFSLTLFMAQFATASSPRPCSWYMDIEPFYVKTTDTLISNSLFAVKVADPGILGDFKKEYPLNIKNSLGGRFALGYALPCYRRAHYGLSVEYTFLSSSNDSRVENDSRDSTAAEKPVLAPAEFIDLIDEASGRFSKATSKLDQHYSTLDFLMHRYSTLPACTSLNVFAGLRYFHLQEKLHNVYNFSGPIDGITILNNYDVLFRNEANQVGPHIGSAVSYPLLCGISATGQVTASLLYGETHSRFNNSYILTPSSVLGEETILSSSNHHDDSAHFTPALSGKVGLAYQGCINRSTTVVIEAGYRGEKYFNAANDVAFQQLLAGDDINSNSNYQDFDISGPYVCLTVRS